MFKFNEKSSFGALHNSKKIRFRIISFLCLQLQDRRWEVVGVADENNS